MRSLWVNTIEIGWLPPKKYLKYPNTRVDTEEERGEKYTQNERNDRHEKWRPKIKKTTTPRSKNVPIHQRNKVWWSVGYIGGRRGGGDDTMIKVRIHHQMRTVEKGPTKSPKKHMMNRRPAKSDPTIKTAMSKLV
jgi:hypothetical protein